jgi:hypothetical protein
MIININSFINFYRMKKNPRYVKIHFRFIISRVQNGELNYPGQDTDCIKDLEK